MRMNQHIRFVSCILAGLLMMSTIVLSSCGHASEQPSGIESNPDAVTTAIETVVGTDPVMDALETVKKTADWGGKDFGILYLNDINGYTEEVEATAMAGEQSSSTVMNDAVFERNTLFEEYCHLSFVLIPTGGANFMSALQSEVQTGTGDFHLAVQTTAGTANAATSGLLYNYLDLDIDYDREWWDKGTLDFALDGRVFFMDGPFNIVDDDVTFVMMFNKGLREEYQVANPYDMVKNGEWTLDVFNSIIMNLSTDNGDGKWDENDTYGFTAPATVGDTFFYGADLQYIYNSRDMEMPTLALTDAKLDRAIEVLRIAREIVQNNHSSYISEFGSEALPRDIFMDNRSLFYVEAANYLRPLNASMEGEYGVVPIPKYDKQQERHVTWRHSIGSTLSIPTSVASHDMDAFADVLEVYTLLSQQYVRPAYYDTLLTVRNVHDVESSQMMDIIFLNRTYDMAIYFDALGFNGIFASSVVGADKFASRYASVSRAFDRNISTILKKLNQTDAP